MYILTAEDKKDFRKDQVIVKNFIIECWKQNKIKKFRKKRNKSKKKNDKILKIIVRVYSGGGAKKIKR